ncbi:MAG: hypothetical protein IPK16_32905 [Anaerolineales bacterium]|nr:hypothetical protein [Anaerolineales bacterium]
MDCAQALIAHVPAVQLCIRMWVPPDSALLAEAETAEWLGELDAGNFTYRWVHADPRMDALHAEVTRLAELADDEDPYGAFAVIEAAAYFVAGRRPPPTIVPVAAVAPPRLSEHWFC